MLHKYLFFFKKHGHVGQNCSHCCLAEKVATAYIMIQIQIKRIIDFQSKTSSIIKYLI